MSIEYVIHLRNDQQDVKNFSHPLFQIAEDNRINDEISHKLLAEYINPATSDEDREEARQELIEGHMYLINHLVGRYLRYWPQCREFIEDMYGEGMLAVAEMVTTFDNDGAAFLRAKIVVKSKLYIEQMLNTMRYPIHACLRTQYSRLKEGRAPEYEDIVAYPKAGAYFKDTEYAVIDLLDSIERIKECDTEEMIDLVLLALENNHNIRKQDLSEEDYFLVEQLVKMGGSGVFTP